METIPHYVYNHTECSLPLNKVFHSLSIFKMGLNIVRVHAQLFTAVILTLNCCER